MRFETQSVADRRSSHLTTALVVLVTLTGCGGSQSNPTTPTAAPTPTPAIVVASGELAVSRGSYIDVDSATLVTASSPDADLFFYVDTSPSMSIWGGLLVRNGAGLGIFGRSLPPGKAGCSVAGATGLNANVEVARLTAGTYLCIRTTSNRYSQVRIVTEAGPSAGPILGLAVETYQ